MKPDTEGQLTTFLDLSHTVEDGLVTYRGLPAPIIGSFMSREESEGRYAPGTTFHIGRIEMVANTGTYIDAPSHRFAHGKDLSELPLGKVAGLEGIVIRATGRDQRAIGAEYFRDRPLAGRAVLVHTGWSDHWSNERYFEGHPYLTAEAAVHLRDAGATLVGIDSLNIDDTRDGKRPAHTILLEAEIPVVEHLTNLAQLPDADFRFFAVPVKVKALGSFPVRAFAMVFE